MSEGYGAKIKASRLAAGMTQKQVGELCGIDPATIRKYEAEKLHPKIETAFKIADALGVPVGNIMPESEKLRPKAKWVYSQNTVWVTVSGGRVLKEPAVKCTHCGGQISESDYLRFIWNFCPVCGFMMEDGTNE